MKKRQSAIISFAVVAGLCWCLVPSLVSACSMSYSTTKVAGDFSVVLRDRGQPRKGFEIRLTKETEASEAEDKLVAVAWTDKQGRVRFGGLAEGRYWVSVGRAGISDSASVEVVKESKRRGKRSEIPLEWPGSGILRSRLLAGRLSGWIHRPTDNPLMDLIHRNQELLKRASLTVTQAGTGKLIWKGETDENGGFEVPNVEAGLYVLGVEESPEHQGKRKTYWDIKAAIPVEITPESAGLVLNLVMRMTSCGPMYENNA